MSKFKETLTKDAGWKLLSVFIAICLWFIVINIENPVETRIFTANLDIINASYAEEAGKTITNADEIENTKVSVRLRGKRMVLDKIQQNKSFSAYIDISSIDMESSPDEVSLPVKIKTGLLASDYVDTEYITPSDVDVYLDENVSKDFKVEAIFNGNVESGVSVSSEAIDPESVKVYGAKGDVLNVASVKAAVNLDSPHNGQKVTSTLAAYDANGNIISNVYISRDVAVVTLKMETERKIPIQVQYTGEPADGCNVGKVNVSPDYVMVSASPDILGNIMYVTLPDVDITGSSADVVRTYDASAYLPQGAEIADGSGGRITVTVEITGKEEHNISFDSDNIEITGEAEGVAEVEKDSFNIEVSGSGITDEDIKYYIDVTGLTPGEHRVQINVSLPDECSLIGQAPYATVIISEETQEVSSEEEETQ